MYRILQRWRERHVKLMETSLTGERRLGRHEYLDLAVREYIAAREEMNALIRLELTLILGAIAVIGGAMAAIAADLAGPAEVARAFVLQVVGTFGLVMFIAAIGVANAFVILEAYITSSAAEIERLSSDGRPRHLGSIQRKIRRWTRQRTRRNRIAWMISYGTTQVLAVIALVLIATIAGAGFFGTTAGDSLVILARAALGLFDAILGAIAAGILAGSLFFAQRWDEVMGE